MKRRDETPKDVPVGMVEVLVSRVGYVRFADGTARDSMLLAVMHGDCPTGDGAKLHFAAAGTTLRFEFKYPGDDDEAKLHQRYDININDLAEAIHELNKRRRAEKFADAPVEVRS